MRTLPALLILAALVAGCSTTQPVKKEMPRQTRVLGLTQMKAERSVGVVLTGDRVVKIYSTNEPLTSKSNINQATFFVNNTTINIDPKRVSCGGQNLPLPTGWRRVELIDFANQISITADDVLLGSISHATAPAPKPKPKEQPSPAP